MSEQMGFFNSLPPRAPIDGTGGARASMSGKQAEDFIYCFLKERGYVVERQVLVGSGIYNTPTYVDFRVKGVRGFEEGLIIESKWQASSGSADEKYPFLVANILRCYPHPTIVVVGGGGMRDGALGWLKAQADGWKLWQVYTFEEFMLWAMNTL